MTSTSTPTDTPRPTFTFRLIVAAETLSLSGDQLLSVVLPLLLFDRTGSVSLAAACALARVVPAAVLGAVGGALVDKLPRRRLLVCASLGRSACVLPLLLVVLEVAPLGTALLFVALLSAFAQVSGPAVGASVPLAVPAAELPRANARLAARSVVLQLLAPVAGATAYARAGAGPVVALDSLLFLGAALLWRRLPNDLTATADAPRLLSHTRAGIHRVLTDLELRRLLGAVGVSLVGLTLFLAVQVPYVREALHGGPEAVGVLTSLEAAGGLLAAALLPWATRRYSTPALIRLGMLGLPAATLGLLLSSGVVQAVPGMVLAGLLLTVLTAATRTQLQLTVEQQALGRVLGVIGAVMGLSAVIGSALAIGLSLVMPLRGCLAVAVAVELAGVAYYLKRRT